MAWRCSYTPALDRATGTIPWAAAPRRTISLVPPSPEVINSVSGWGVALHLFWALARSRWGDQTGLTVGGQRERYISLCASRYTDSPAGVSTTGRPTYGLLFSFFFSFLSLHCTRPHVACDGPRPDKLFFISFSFSFLFFFFLPFLFCLFLFSFFLFHFFILCFFLQK